MLEWMWARGWDAVFGGMLSFVGGVDKPVQDYWHDMKFWWPYNETEIATKGTLWKGPFHAPRMMLMCWQICEEMLTD